MHKRYVNMWFLDLVGYIALVLFVYEWLMYEIEIIKEAYDIVEVESPIGIILVWMIDSWIGGLEWNGTIYKKSIELTFWPLCGLPYGPYHDRSIMIS